MNSIICTLFEGHYHYGVAALTNSLYKQGFRGEICAGFRGTIPVWAKDAQNNDCFGFTGAKTLHIAKDLLLHFLPLITDYHLTNYKPDFMLQILENATSRANSIFYFDPDIVVNASWPYLTEWVESGIAVCEDINSPLAEFHPRRTAWRQYYKTYGIQLNFKNGIYVNGCFVGLTAFNKSFLITWKAIQEAMALAIGGLNRSALEGVSLPENAKGPFAPFGKTDQDALNAALEAWSGNISFAGKEGMAFQPGEPVMSHALGRPKPWLWKPVMEAFDGRPPRLAERNYWDFVTTPIRVYSSARVRYQKVCISIAIFIGRFYHRGNF